MAVVNNPVADIVKTRSIPVCMAAAIAHPFKIVREVAPRGAVFADGVGEGEDGLDKSGAVEFGEVDSDHFRFPFEGVGHVRCAEEFLAKPCHAGFRRGQIRLPTFDEQRGDSCCVSFLVVETQLF